MPSRFAFNSRMASSLPASSAASSASVAATSAASRASASRRFRSSSSRLRRASSSCSRRSLNTSLMSDSETSICAAPGASPKARPAFSSSDARSASATPCLQFLPTGQVHVDASFPRESTARFVVYSSVPRTFAARQSPTETISPTRSRYCHPRRAVRSPAPPRRIRSRNRCNGNGSPSPPPHPPAGRPGAARSSSP